MIEQTIIADDYPYSRQTVKFLLDSQAFMVWPDRPFKLASGLYSPFYINCRKLIFHPEARTKIADYLAFTVEKKLGSDNFDVIAGGATGVPFATLVADRLQKPLVYIRTAKDGSLQAEGGKVQGKRTLLVEDLVTDGGSKIKFTSALRGEGAVVENGLVVLSRASDEILKKLADYDLQLHAICPFDLLLHTLDSMDTISPDSLNEIKKFLDNPEKWSKDYVDKVA